MTTSPAAALAAYIPRDRAAQIFTGAPLATEGAALIADISGFTPLTEALARALSPARGAEELTRALNSVFAPLIAEVHARGGCVVKFGGDALITWFPRHGRGWRAATLRRALGAALAMQAAIARHGRVTTDAGIFTLTMKVGVAYGPVLRTRLGDPARGFEDVIGGRTLDRMAAAEHHAGPGEVLVDPEGLPELGELAAVAFERDGLLVVSGLRGGDGRGGSDRGFSAPPGEHTTEEALRPYVPAEVYEAVRHGREHPAELKPVVSIFVQFTGISYEAGAEAEARLQRYFAAAQAVAARYGARVNRLITGDKGSVLHLIVGAPRAVEELERRAALCALELRRAAAGLPFRVDQRVGMTMGRVFAGPVGAPARRDYTVMGEAINRSARLMQRAEPGQIVVDAALAERLAAAFDLAPLGQARLKGVAEPLELFDLTGEAEVATARPAPQLAGRDAELAALRAAVGCLRAGQGGVVTISGDLGMGKSHLLAALRAEVGPAVVWGGGGATGYGLRASGAVVAAALRDLLGLPAGPDAARGLGPALARLLGPRRGAEAAPYLARLLGLPLEKAQARELEALGGEGLRWRLLRLAGELAAAAAARGPLVIALDDLQWADPTSLELTEALLPAARSGPLLLLLAARPDVQGRAAGLLGRLVAAGAPVVALAPLDERAAAAVVAHHAPGLGEAAVARLVSRGGGNPLFLVELARTAAAGAPLDELPDTVQGLLLAQIDRLPAAQRVALQVAAVLGAQITAPLAAEVGGSPIVEGDLAALEAAGFLARADEAAEGYSFRHGLIRESAYGALLYERRRTWHSAAATALERRNPTRLVELAGALALHYEGAGDLARAARSYGQAADAARLLYANEEAETGYRRTLELLDAAGVDEDGLRGRTYLKLAQVRMNAGDYAVAQELYDRAFELLEREEVARPAGRRRTPVFRMGSDEPETLDPAFAQTTGTLDAILILFEGLVSLDAELNIVPAVARRWRVEEGGTRYVFELRSGLRWSDGAPLTAHDFVFAWRRNLHPSTSAGLAQRLSVISGVLPYQQGQVADVDQIGLRAPDPLTLEVDLEAPVGYFLALLADPITFPQPAHSVERFGAGWSRPERLVCNGPYRVSHWRPGRDLELRRNPHYRAASGVALERVRLLFLAPGDDLAHYDELDLHRIVGRVEAQPEDSAQLMTLNILATYFLVFACDREPTDQLQLRQAMAACVDRERLVQEVWGGVQRVANGGIVPAGLRGHSPGLGVTFDPTASAATSPALHNCLQLHLGATIGFGETPRFLQRSWREYLGLDVVVTEDVPIEELLTGLQSGLFQVALLGWEAEYPDPDSFLRALFHSASPVNYFGWSSSRFDGLVDRAAHELAQGERAALYHEAEQLLVADEVVAVPLYYARFYGMLRPGFQIRGGARVIHSGRLTPDQVLPTSKASAAGAADRAARRKQ